MSFLVKAFEGFCFGFGLIMIALVMKLLFHVGFCG